MLRRSHVVTALAALAVTSCVSLLGISDPEVDAPDAGTLPDGSADGPSTDSGRSDAEDDAGLVCPLDRADCNGNQADGCETDTTTPSNCGSCGHVCPACSAGQCVPETVASGSGLDYAGFIGVDDTQVYWTSVGSKGLYAAPKSGSGASTPKISADPFDATSIYVGAKYIGATVYSLAVGVRMYDPANQNAISGIQVDACSRALGFVADETGAVYYAHGSQLPGSCPSSSFDITKRTPAGLNTFMETWTFTAGEYRAGETESMVLDATFLYFIGYRETAGGLYKINRAGGSASPVALDHFNSAPLAIDATSIYTIVNGDETMAGAALLVAYDKANNARTTLATGERSFALTAVANGARRASIAVDATHVYWTAADDAALPTSLGRIMRIPKTGGMKEVLADKQQGAYGLAIDATHVYWTTSTAIKRIPK